MKIADAWFEAKRAIVLAPDHFRRWRTFRAKYPVGTIVCCCDNQHRTIAWKEKPDVLVMTNGGRYDAFQCVEPVREDGMCHIPYQVSGQIDIEWIEFDGVPEAALKDVTSVVWENDMCWPREK